MRLFLKIAAVLMITIGGYYLLMGFSTITASSEIGRLAVTYNEELPPEEAIQGTLDPSEVAKAATQMGAMMLGLGVLECAAGGLALLGGKRRGLLIAGSILSALLMIWNIVSTVTAGDFNAVYMIEVALPLLLLAACLGVLRLPEERSQPALRRL